MAITAERLTDGTFRFHGRANDITRQKNKALEPFGKQLLNYGQVLRLLPTPEQAQALNQQIASRITQVEAALTKGIGAEELQQFMMTIAKMKQNLMEPSVLPAGCTCGKDCEEANS